MTKDQVNKLPLGVYRIHWKESSGGGSSVAAVGQMHDGQRWLAPANWTAPKGQCPISTTMRHWASIESVVLIIDQ